MSLYYDGVSYSDGSSSTPRDSGRLLAGLDRDNSLIQLLNVDSSGNLKVTSGNAAGAGSPVWPIRSSVTGTATLALGEASINTLELKTFAAYDQAGLFVSSGSGMQLIFGNKLYNTADYGFAVQTTPTLYFFSHNNPATNGTEWGSITHDATDLYFNAGKGRFKWNRGHQFKFTSVAADTTLDASHHFVAVDATGAARAITLPTTPAAGTTYYVYKTDGGANAVTITRGGANTIEGANTLALAAQYDSALLVFDGTATWIRVSQL